MSTHFHVVTFLTGNIEGVHYVTFLQLESSEMVELNVDAGEIHLIGL